MNILVNGEKRTISAEVLSIADILVLLKVENPDMVTVQLNEEFVDRANYSATLLKDNDRLDFLYFMGGGQ